MTARSFKASLTVMVQRKRVIVVHPAGNPQLMPTLRGINDYALRKGDWDFQFNPVILSPGLKHLRHWPGHGIIALLQTRAELAAARQIGMPVVNLSGAIQDTGLPRVMVDQEALGRLAAEYLMACGLTRFAYYGERDMWYSQQRKRAFMERLALERHSCSLQETTTRIGFTASWYSWIQSLEKWLGTLHLPAGLFAVHDHAAAMIVHACSQLGLRVPEDLAVLGVGNDRSVCEFSQVSSIARNYREVGYQAAALLDRLMAGEPPPEHDILIPPEGVVERRSTEVVAADDPRLSAAVRYIQENLGRAISIRELCDTLDVSHRCLDLLFRNHLRCTPREYLSRVRIQRAKRLLAGSRKLKMQTISRLCGFNSPRRLYAAFRRIAGVTLAEYRQRAREEY